MVGPQSVSAAIAIAERLAGSLHVALVGATLALTVCLPVYAFSEFLKFDHEVLHLSELLKPVREVEHPFPAAFTLVDGDRCLTYLHDPDLMDSCTGDVLQLGDDGGEFISLLYLLNEPLRIVK